MKKLLSLILLVWSLMGFAQTDVPDKNTLLIKDTKTDFAVPDQPAFSILGTTPSNILRPSNIKEFSMITSDYFTKIPYVIPRSLAIEIAPVLLLKGKKSLADYQENWRAYNLRISVGTGEDKATEKRNVAIGLRYTIVNKGDLRRDKSFLDELEALGKAHNKSKEDYMTEYQEKFPKPTGLSQEKYEERKEAYATRKANEAVDVEQLIDKARETYKSNNWNKDKCEIALAILFNSSDSLLKNASYRRFAAWGNYALHAGKNGQVVLNANFVHDRKRPEVADSGFYNRSSLSLNARAYVGVNRVKGFLEGQYVYMNSTLLKYDSLGKQEKAGNAVTSNILLNAGLEWNVTDGVWLLFNTGYKWNFARGENSKPSDNTFTVASNWTYQFDLRFNLPEKFKLF